jgi:DNA-binding MurR/RpiR family transcriptional regulator
VYRSAPVGLIIGTNSASKSTKLINYAIAFVFILCYIGIMTYEERIRETRPRMSKSFTRLANYILDSYVHAALMTATELAHQVDVDAATVVRFAQKLGYSGFPELQTDVKNRVKQDLLIRPEQAEEPDSVPGVVNATMLDLSKAIEQARKLLDVNAVSELTDQFGKAGRILIAPEGLGMAAAYNLVNLLEHGGFKVTQTIPTATDLARSIYSAEAGDLMVVIDISGNTGELTKAIELAKSKGIVTVAIVGAASHSTASKADLVLAAQNQPDIGLGIVVVDAIIYTLAKALHWQYKDRFKGSEEEIKNYFERIQSSE